jgi:micrococcal nuclease
VGSPAWSTPIPSGSESAIDAPETHNSNCPKENRLGEQATVKLQTLLNAGAFEMVAPIYGQKDRYSRDLRVIRRTRPDEGTQSIADDIRTTGLAHRYMGGFKPGWC